MQSRILRELERYDPLVHTLLRGAPSKAVREAEEASATIRDAVDQSHGTYDTDPQDVLAKVREAFETHREHLAALYDASPGEHVYVPDANAVIWNTKLDEWAFPGSPRFSVVLTSTFLGELDDLKRPGRSDSLREKAEGAIRRIKGYRERDDLSVGVTLKSGVSTIRATAVEPNFESAPGWLDPEVKDDRLIASVLEIMREHPQSPVVLVTRDLNMQTKATHAGIPFVEPPDPTERDPPRARKPSVDMRVLDIRTQGGSEGRVDFVADVQYGGANATRATYRAYVGDEEVRCNPPYQDMVGNHMPWQVAIEVPRPIYGELVKELNGATTLYGNELVLEVLVDDEVVAKRAWTEKRYNPFTEATQARIQKHVVEEGRRRLRALGALAPWSTGPH